MIFIDLFQESNAVARYKDGSVRAIFANPVSPEEAKRFKELAQKYIDNGTITDVLCYDVVEDDDVMLGPVDVSKDQEF